MSLPLAFGTTLATVPARVPYLRAPTERVAAWRTRLPAGRRVGLVWSGKPSHKNDRNRSIPSRSSSRFWRSRASRFVSLQREIRAADLAGLAQCPNLVRLEEALTDFADTAAVIEQLRPRHRRRYRGCASGGRARQAGLRPDLLYPGLALACGPRRQSLVPDCPHLPAARTRRLGQRDCGGRPGAGRALSSRQLSARLRYHAGTMAPRPKQAEPRPVPRLYLVTPRLHDAAAFAARLRRRSPPPMSPRCCCAWRRPMRAA